MRRLAQRSVLMRSTSTVAVVAGLLVLAALNVARRATWSEVEDGVLWRSINGDVVAGEIARGTAAERGGLQPGDVLDAIDGRPIGSVDEVVGALHASAPGQRLHYAISRMRTRQAITIEVAPV